ncbi:MAG TPA: hypothetical protein VF897_23975 [Roseiflexaceae bacterium]
MTDQRPPYATGRRGDGATGQWQLAHSPTRLLAHSAIRWFVALLLVLVLLALTGCSMRPAETPAQANPGGGGPSPEAVATSFFDDLGQALKDPQLADDKRRGEWVDRLAGYFAPNERDDQRIALSTALDSFATGLGKLDPNENLTLELRFEGIEKLSDNGSRALVRPVNGSIYVLITRTTSAGVANLYEDNVGLDKIISAGAGAVPVVRIGRSWFLTEG